MIIKNPGLSTIVCALLVVGITGCIKKYTLGGQLPSGLHSTYERNHIFTMEYSIQGKDGIKKSTVERISSDELQLIYNKAPQNGERILLYLQSNKRFQKATTDGKTDDIVLQYKSPQFVDIVPLDVVGEASHPAINSIEVGGPYPLYFLDKIFALPTKPMRAGDEWSMHREEEGCRVDMGFRLDKVEKRGGKRVAIIKGAGKIAGPNTGEPPEPKIIRSAEIADYTREVDLDTHVTLSVTYILRESGDGGEKIQYEMLTKSSAALRKTEILDNEKWQPGISAFAKALVDTNDPHKVISAMKNIIAFAGANRDTPLGQYAREVCQDYDNVGKNVWEMLEFDKGAQWFNTGGLKKEDLEGKVFMLEFWATWCGPCTAAAPKIARLYDELSPQGFTVVGVSQDQDITAEEMQAFLKDHGTNYPIYWDKTAKVTLSFDIEGIPHSVLVGRDGTILWEGMPYDEKFMRDLILSVLKPDETKKPPEKNKPEGTAPASSGDKPANS